MFRRAQAEPGIRSSGRKLHRAFVQSQSEVHGIGVVIKFPKKIRQELVFWQKLFMGLLKEEGFAHDET